MKYLIIILVIYSNLAISREVRVNNAAGVLILQTGLSSQRDLLGADIWFLGEKQGERRNVLSLLYQDKNIKLNQEVTRKGYSTHKAQMRIFGKDSGYSDMKFSEYKVKKVSDKLAYHFFSWSYLLKEQRFLEESYYIECGDMFFISKATTLMSSIKDQKKFRAIIEGAKCLSI